MNKTIFVGLIEDQYLFREGMKAIIADWPDIKVVFESGDGFSVLDKLSKSSYIPNVMLVDLSLPSNGDQEFSGLHTMKMLLGAYPDMKIIILSVHNDENYISKLIDEGAHSYLLKDSDPKEVLDAIQSVYQKGIYINETTLNAIKNNLGHKKKSKKLNLQITKREQDILQLICQQFTTDEIAKKLFISVKTVNGHRNNLLQKTASRNVTGLVLYAIKKGIVEL